MNLSRRRLLAASTLALAGGHWRRLRAGPRPDVRFEATWDSLRNYSTPQWYRVELLATGARLPFKRDASGLTVNLPATLPGDYAFAFKILGRGLAVEGDA